MNAKPFQFTLLGEWSLQRATGDSVEVTSKKSRALLTFLALMPGCRASRERVAGLLWSDTDLPFAKTNLRQCLSTLRKQIGVQGHNLLKADGNNLRLDTDSVLIDALQLQRLEQQKSPSEPAEFTAFYNGMLLPEFPLIDPEFDACVDEGVKARLFAAVPL